MGRYVPVKYPRIQNRRKKLPVTQPTDSAFDDTKRDEKEERREICMREDGHERRRNWI
jgi:hypothetical protein